MEISYCDLKQKEVVNIADGKRLGRILDIVISLNSCRVLGVVVPGNRKIFNTKEDIFVPWKNIQKIGADVILVCLTQCNTDEAIKANHCDIKGNCGVFESKPSANTSGFFGFNGEKINFVDNDIETLSEADE